MPLWINYETQPYHTKNKITEASAYGYSLVSLPTVISPAKIQNFWIMQQIKNKKMIKSVTRTLYIDGRLVESQTQEPCAWSELADLEHIAAGVELQEKAQRRSDVGNDAADAPSPFGKGRPKAIKLKLKLLQAVSKMLLLGHKATVESHVVCLYVEHHVETPAEEPPHTAQA